MKFFTPEKTASLEWAEKNMDELHAQYDGKYILVHGEKVISSSLSEEELIKTAKNLKLEEHTFIIMAIGKAILPVIQDSGLWW